jgi:NAD(P)-dependent dehydrogenase (short-subunit alcohol dehydrogenase family)
MTYLESLFSLAGRQALVTGAARGNGRAIAEGLLRAGARVLLVDIAEAELDQTVREFQKSGLDARGERCDLAEVDQIESLATRVAERMPNLSILVNNAGVTLPGNFVEYPLDRWDLTYRVNLRAPFLLSQRLVPLLGRTGGGVILNVTSINAELAFPDNPAYVAFKGGLRQLTKAMALDLWRFGIRVNAIGPGYIRTAMTRGSWESTEKREERQKRTVLGRWGEPEDLAGVAVFLASKASGYITGQDIYVDGGWLAKGL